VPLTGQVRRAADGHEALHGDGAGLGELEQSLVRVPTSHARLLPAARRGVDGAPRGGEALVDVHGARLQLRGDLAGWAYGTPHGGVEAVGGVVCPGHGFINS